MADQITPKSKEELRFFLETYENQIKNGLYDLNLAMISIKEISSKDLSFLALYSRSSQILLAKNRDTPKNIFYLLTRISRVELNRLLAKNPFTPVQILHELASDIDNETRKNVAENPNAPRKTVKKLLKDSDDTIKKIAKNHPNRPLYKFYIAGDFDYILKAISKDDLSQVEFDEYHAHPNPYIREKIASHTMAPMYILKRLMKDEDENVRLAVIKNAKASWKIVKYLTNDRNVDIKRLAYQKKEGFMVPGGWLKRFLSEFK